MASGNISVHRENSRLVVMMTLPCVVTLPRMNRSFVLRKAAPWIDRRLCGLSEPLPSLQASIRTFLRTGCVMQHTQAHALDRGCPIHLVQATLGHALEATTGRYLHARPTDIVLPDICRCDREKKQGSLSRPRAPGSKPTGVVFQILPMQAWFRRHSLNSRLRRTSCSSLLQWR